MFNCQSSKVVVEVASHSLHNPIPRDSEKEEIHFFNPPKKTYVWAVFKVEKLKDGKVIIKIIIIIIILTHTGMQFAQKRIRNVR